MRKIYIEFISRVSFLLFILVAFLSSSSNSQTVTIEGTGSASSHLYGPIYTFNAQPRSFRGAFIYSQPLLSAMPAGSLITKLQFSRSAAGISLPAGNNLKLYLMNTTANDWGSGALTWDISSATLVYDGDPAAIIGSTIGYKEFILTSSFIYTGNNLALYSEYSQVNGPTTNLTWDYNTATTQPGYSANQIKYTANSSSTMPASLGTSNSNHANIKIDFTGAAACTAPPVAGNATVTPTTPVCTGSPVTLNVTGNSTGTGQTYIWQSSSTATGTYNNVSTSSGLSSLVVNPSVTAWYRVAVTCSGNTAYSAPVEVVVSPALPGGTYTINPGLPTGSGNYQTITAAVNALSCGIAGPIVFDVAIGSGPYNEQITIPQIGGASAINTITFRGNGSTIQFTPISANRHLIKLDGADYIRISNFNLQGQDATYGWGVHLTNGADHNTIDSSTINISAVTSTTQSNSAGIVISGSSTSVTTAGSASFNTFDRNTITGAYQGIILTGTATALNAVGNTISNNTIQDFYQNGITLSQNDGATVSRNNISRANRSGTTTFAGVEVGTGCRNTVVDGNMIHDTHNAATSQSGTAYGIFLSGSDAPAGSENKVINNLIYNFNSTTGTIYGLYNSGSDSAWYYHNTVVLDHGGSTSGTTRGFYQTTAANGIQLKNNIFYVTRGGSGAKHCVYFGTTTSTIVSNKNVFYLNSPAGTNGVGSFGTTNFVSLTDWQGANGNAYDQQSISTDPQFVNPGASDFTPGAPSLNNIGDNVGVTTDILGNPRNVTNPDPGAFEFSLGGCTNPPIPGVATTTQAIVCPGETFTLDLINNSIGDGQTYQWQSSPDNITFTNVGTAASITALVTSQTATAYYRAAVKCSAGTTVYSDTVLVTTPGLVSGTFTINNAIPTGATNFATFNDAVNYIKCGVSGPVVFNVMAGTSYNEQVIIPAVAGTSAVNTITFNGNGSVLQYLSTSSSERATLKLEGSDYIIIDSLQIMAVGSQAAEYGFGVHLVNDADNNIIRRSTISATTTPTTAASTNFAGVVINAATATSPIGTGNSLCDNNTISGNRITGGYVGISVTANSSTNTITGNKILNNTVQDFYTYGIFINGNVNAVVEGNDISRPGRNSVTVFYGINLDDVNLNTLISKNRIHNPFDANAASTSAAYGIRLINADAKPGNENVISNNMIYSFNGGTGTQNGILVNASDSARLYFNSVLLDDGAASCNCVARAVYVQSATVAGLDIRNNILSVGRGGTGEKQALYFDPANISGYTIDHNNYFTSAGSGTQELVHVGTSGYTTLAAWQAASGKDANAMNVDPLFISSTDLHLQGGSILDDKGMPIASVTTDIDGHIRDAMRPDIGADETPLSSGPDMKAAALLSPVLTKGCYNTENITVTIKNNSVSAINFATTPVTVTVNVTGAVTAVYTAIVNTGSLAAGASQDVTMTTPAATLVMTANGTYTFVAKTTLAGDVNTANDVLPAETRTKTALTAGTVSISRDSYCVTGGTPTLTVTGAEGYATIQWQQSTTAGTGFSDIIGANETSYTVASPITQSMYYRVVASCGTGTQTSAEVAAILNNPQVVTTAPGTHCGPGTVTLGATGSAGTTLNWYAAATGGTAIGTGTAFTTPSLTSTTTYYVAASAGGSAETAGKSAPTTTPNTTGDAWGLVFNVVNQPINLASVDIYSVGSASGTISVELTNSSGTVIATAGPFAYPAGSTASPSLVTLPLNFTVPVGTGYRLLSADMSGGSVIRETSGNSFPFTSASGNVVLTSGYISGTSTTYYWFYNWQVSTGCESPRTAVAATISAPPALTTSPDVSVCAGETAALTVTSLNDPNYTYTWTPGNLSGASQTVLPLTTTTYTVNAIDNSTGTNAGCVNTKNVTVSVKPVPAPVTITPDAATICTGSPAQLLTASGGSMTGVAALSENFNGTATGWTTENTTTGSAAASAAWTLRPDGYDYESTIFHSNDNSQFYLTNSDAAGSGSTTNTALQSPVFSLAGYTTASLSFWHYYRTASAPESITVKISTNGTTWTTLQTYTTLQGAPAGFVNVNLNLDTYAGQPTVSLRFEYNAGFDWYWAIDNVLVSGNQNASITWSPVAGLFTDAAATIPYTGTAATTLYANPATATIYTASATNVAGCSSSSTVNVTLNQSAVINTQPVGQAVCPGDNAVFSVDATYASSYQWKKDGAVINGATSSTYVITNAGSGDVATYTVEVIGTCGNTTSNPAALSLGTPTAITAQPTDIGVCPGGTATFNVTADGTGLTYQWRKGGVAINGANSSSYIINGAATGDAGNYDVVITGDCGNITSSVAALSLDGITVSAQPLTQAICEGEAVTFTVTAVGTGLTYKWRKGGTDISGATSSSYTINAIAAGDAGDYDVVIAGTCGSDTSDIATLTVNQLTAVTGQPAAQTVCPADPVTFSVTATGAGVLTYQWRKDGNNINGANSSTLTISSVATGDAGSYDVIVTGTCDADTSGAVTLTVNTVTAISTEPVAQTVCSGQNATFNVTALGTGIIYQWRKDGVDIPGATAASYTITGATSANVGSYDVIVSGACRKDTSIAVNLVINAVTAITTQPVAQAICIGGDVTFSIAATGTNLSYQWRKAGNNIAGATAATYTITGAAAGDAADYDVVITGTCGNLTSTAVALTVNPAGAWTGATSSDWNTASNWCGTIPTSSTDILIPATAPNMPVLAATGTARNITISAGATLTVAANATLEVSGNITNNGVFNAAAGSITFNGTASQSIPAFTATNVTMNGNGGIVLSGNAVVNGTLTLTNGHITLGSNTITLASTATGSSGSHIITNGTGHVVVSNLAASSTRVVPVGINAASYNPVVLAATATHTTDNFTVRVHPGVFENGTGGTTFAEYVVDRTWVINEGTGGGSNVNVTLQWAATHELARFERQRSYVMQHNGTSWLQGTESAANGNDPYTQTKTGVTSFTSFAVQKQPIPDAPYGLYPNPVPHTLNIVVRPRQAEQMTMTVYDLSGRVMIVQTASAVAGANLFTMDVSKLVAGMYTLKVSTPRDKEFMVKKFLKVN